MGLISKLHKLGKMPPEELFARISERTGQISERREFNRTRGGACNVSPALADIADQLATRAQRYVPGASRWQISQLGAIEPDLHAQLRETVLPTADRLLAGEIELLGRTVKLPPSLGERWHCDPLSDYRWPAKFYADLPLYELPDEVDVKYVWELNRHQFLAHLGQAWLLTGDDRYAIRARELLLDWIEHNPLYAGVNWTSSLEPAMRVISWLWTAAALSEWSGWQQEDWIRIAGSLAEHGRYLERHQSLYSSPYNHLIGEATGLLLLGHWLSGTPAAEHWCELGGSLLKQHGPRQFYSDGFCMEQACGYHFYTLGFLTLAMVVAGHSGRPLAGLGDLVAKAWEAAAPLRQPNGRWPAIGDVDSARTFPTPVQDDWDFRPLYSVAATWCDVPSLKQADDRPGAELFWLLGSAGVARWQQLPAQGVVRSKLLPDAGYAVACDDHTRDWLLFDVGPIAAGLHADRTPSVAHGHADMLQLLLCRGGEPLLFDAAMPRYGGSREWVDFFREPCAHNTLEVQGAPMAQVAGRLAWSHVVQRPEFTLKLAHQAWLLRGTLALPDGVTVERCVLAMPGEGVWVADRIRSSTRRRVWWHWQLPDDSELLESSAIGHRDPTMPDHQVRAGNQSLAIWTASDALGARLTRATSDDPRGWQAPGYGQLRAGAHLELESEVQGSLLVVTCLADEPRAATVVLDQDRLVCQTARSSFSPALPQLTGDAVCWSVATSQGAETFLAGTSPDFDGSNWRLLQGLGSWHVYHAASRKAPSQGTGDSFGSPSLFGYAEPRQTGNPTSI